MPAEVPAPEAVGGGTEGAAGEAPPPLPPHWTESTSRSTGEVPPPLSLPFAPSGIVYIMLILYMRPSGILLVASSCGPCHGRSRPPPRLDLLHLRADGRVAVGAARDAAGRRGGGAPAVWRGRGAGDGLAGDGGGEAVLEGESRPYSCNPDGESLMQL